MKQELIDLVWGADLTAGERLVALAVAFCTDDDGVCRVGTRRIADMAVRGTLTPLTSCGSLMRALERRGLLVVSDDPAAVFRLQRDALTNVQRHPFRGRA